MKSREAGVTMVELLIAVTLVALLSVGLLMAMRIGLNSMDRANNRLMSNRRVAGVYRILESQLAGLMPVTTMCSPQGDGPAARIMYFQGEAATMRLVSSYSLQGAWRGYPNILEYQVIPGEQGAGVRLVVNELLYSGPRSAGLTCLSVGKEGTLFTPVQTGPGSFVLADKLAFCRLLYKDQPPPPQAPVWVAHWVKPVLPAAIRIEMGPLTADTSKLPMMTLTIPVRVNRLPLEDYGF